MTRNFSYADSIDYLEHELWNTAARPSRETRLERVAYLLNALGNPHRSFRSVHVTGSCGKGSTTAMVASVLRAAGFRTGHFSSPHLVSYTERIAVDGVLISEEDWARHFTRLYPVIEAMRANDIDNYDLGRPSLFEVFFTLACLHFAEQQVTWAALEAGIGGRLDAPTVVDSEVAVITNVSLEHTKILGNSVEAIAREKAAIIKPGSTAVTASRDPRAVRVIEERTHQVGAPLYRVGVDILIHRGESVSSGQRVTIQGHGRSVGVDLPLLGPFQVENAACAFGAAVALQEHGVQIESSHVASGLANTHVPGRFELLPGRPDIVLDGAHNSAAAEALAQALREQMTGRRIVMVFAAMTDKDVAGMARSLGPVVDCVYLTRAPGTERAADPGELRIHFEAWTSHIRVDPDAETALRRAYADTGYEDVLLLCGSLYLVGFLRPRVMSLVGAA